jgi:cell division protein FtsZ
VVATGIDALAKSDAMPTPRRSAEPVAAPAAKPAAQAQPLPRPTAEPLPEPEPARATSFADHRQAGEIEREELFAEPEAAAVPQPGLHRTAPFGQPKFGEDADRRSGEPSPDALRRLQAAVQNVPKAQPMVRQVASPPRETERHSRLTINSLIHKMTGQVGREQTALRNRPDAEPHAQPIEPDYEDTERERVDIPAFLRRQAN